MLVYIINLKNVSVHNKPCTKRFIEHYIKITCSVLQNNVLLKKITVNLNHIMCKYKTVCKQY